MQDRLQEIEKATRRFIDDPNKAVTGVITIPVVVHVVYNNSSENISDAQIMSQMTVLTDDFRRLNSDANNNWPQAADSEIEFCLATVDPQGNTTSGITRTSTSVTSFSANDNMKFNSTGGKDAWPASDYLNIWVCDLSGGLLGYAQFPGGPSSTDGVVCDYQYFGTTGTATPPFDLGRTATHEVGHWLNLRHIWGDGGCGVDDFVSDTPLSDNPNYGCPAGHSSCGTLDMIENYMDYTDDGCMNLYTDGQKTRMRALFDTNGFRQSLLNSPGCGSGNPATCNDGVQNGNETGVDCGGPDCPPCATCPDSDVTMTIILDDYPEETTWELRDASSNLLASGGPYNGYPSGTAITESFCLADGCYDYTIFDSYGDGICCAYGNGSYELVDDSNNVLASGGAFSFSESTNFCVGGGSNPPTCNDGIQNGNETGVDCGGPDCPPCNTGGCTDQDVDFNDFDSGWGIWNDGGSDCRRSANDAAYAYSGNRCVRLRDNTASSVMTTDNLDLSGFEEISIDFTFIAASMENGEDFWLQASTNGGSSWQTLVVWARGTDFANNVREFESILITGTFSSSTKFRFRCDASNNGDRIYIDDVDITGCYNGGNRQIDESFINPVLEPKSDDNLLWISEFKAFPNPASSMTTIEIKTNEASNVVLNLIDANGRVVNRIEKEIYKGSNRLEMDIQEFEQGLYYLQLQTQTETYIRKLLIIQ